MRNLSYYAVPWLDSTDPAWQEVFQECSQKEEGPKETARFRNMVLVQGCREICTVGAEGVFNYQRNIPRLD